MISIALAVLVRKGPFPKGPRIEKIQVLEISIARLKISSEPPTKPLFFFVGILKVGIEFFKQD